MSKSKPSWSDLTPEQVQRLTEFAAANGLYWKQRLNDAWQSGKDTTLPGGYLLRQIRNTWGPIWLTKLPQPRKENHHV